MSETKMYSVLDKWTDLEKENIVDFTSVDGVVTQARLNGVPVGGGGGDFTTATVTFRNIAQNTSPYMAAVMAIENDVLAIYNHSVNYGDDAVFTVPLYKGKVLIPLSCITENDTGFMPTVEGDAALDLPSMAYAVTGDCLISAKGVAQG